MSAGTDKSKVNDTRRRLLKGAAVAAPLVLTFRGGRAWAFSSCGTEVRGGGQDGLDHHGVDRNPDGSLNGVTESCLHSAEGTSLSRLENLTKARV